MSIYENVVYGLRINGVKDKQVLDEAVEKAFATSFYLGWGQGSLAWFSYRLSGGQQQRVCVARVWQLVLKLFSWMNQPQLWTLSRLVRLRETLYGLKISTPCSWLRSMQQASRISDKTGFFLDGDLIEFNDTKKMFLNPQHREQKIIFQENLDKEINDVTFSIWGRFREIAQPVLCYGTEVLSQINRTVRAFVTHDRDLAKEVIEQMQKSTSTKWNWREIIWNDCPSTTGFSRPAYCFDSSKGCIWLGAYGWPCRFHCKAAIRMKGEQRIQLLKKKSKNGSRCQRTS